MAKSNLHQILMRRRSLQPYPGWYIVSWGWCRIGAHIPRQRRPMLSDGGNSRLREKSIDADSAEPPSLTVPSL
jgi:hypothetical protein